EEYPVNSNRYMPAYKLFPDWAGVDLIGVDSYFQLEQDPLTVDPSAPPDPGVAALKAAWHRFDTGAGVTTDYSDLHGLATTYRRPVFASEIGYADADYTATAPGAGCPQFDSAGKCASAVNVCAQWNAYEAFFETFAGQSWFTGMNLWDIQTDLTLSTTAPQVDPRGLPVENLLKLWWTATAPSTTPLCPNPSGG